MLTQSDVSWSCRFHPTEWFHEVGCPHQEWTKEDLLGALLTKKQFEQQRQVTVSMPMGTPVKWGPCTCHEGGEHHMCPQHGCNCYQGLREMDKVVLSSGQAEINAAIASWSQEDKDSWKEHDAKISGR